jgi:alkanesulfonate monooxygenase SsuD/methylene tetrahydromethanopterin reductase-like flavin-dependent oxidoreductase (luciferase family)
MSFGAQIPGNSTDFSLMRDVAQTMDATRWSSAWTYDHFVPPLVFMDETQDSLEGWMTLAALGEATETLMLGTLVSGVTYRNPGLLAKMTATLDHNTKGRAILGLGAAWHEREHAAYGWDFPELRERSDRLEEACRLIRTLFTADGPVDFQGRYYRLRQAPLAPGCFRTPHIPIMVGGVGERRTLRTLARYGDVFNLNGWTIEMSLPEYRRKAEVIERHCAAVGRDPGEIRHTIHMPLRLAEPDDRPPAGGSEWKLGPGLTPAPTSFLVDRIGEFERAGVDEIIFQPLPDTAYLQRVEQEIVAAFH